MTEDQDTLSDRLLFFSDALVLKSLCNPVALKRLREIRDSDHFCTPRQKANLLLGYKLVVQTALYSMLDEIIMEPELLGLNDDVHLRRWWRRIQGEDGLILNAAITRQYSDLARVASGINGLLISLIQSGASWDLLFQVAESVCPLAEELLSIAGECPATTIAGTSAKLNSKEILPVCVIERLHEYLDERRQLFLAFTYSLRKPTEWMPMQHEGIGLGPLGIVETYRDHVSALPDSPPLKSEWIIGILAAVTVSLQELELWGQGLPNPNEVFENAPDPLEAWNLAVGVLDNQLKGEFPSFKYKLGSPAKLPSKILSTLSERVFLPNSADRLRALFAGNSLLLSSRYDLAVMYFEIVVAGLISTLPIDTKIEVLKIMHGSNQDDVIPVSFAVLIPAIGLMGDYSVWWVFDRVYFINGPDEPYSPISSRVDEILARLDNRINLLELSHIPIDHLLSLSDEGSFQYLASQLKAQHRISSDLRGEMPELLSALLLVHSGYERTRVGLEVCFPDIGKKELDAIGVKSTSEGVKCLIVEVKGKSDSQYDLVNASQSFAEKVRSAGKNPSLLKEYLGYPGTIERVSGLFIAMAPIDNLGDSSLPGPLRDPASVKTIKKLIYGQKNIEFWDFSRFVKELKEAGISDRYLDLLQKSLLPWHMGITLPPPAGHRAPNKT